MPVVVAAAVVLQSASRQERRWRCSQGNPAAGSPEGSPAVASVASVEGSIEQACLLPSGLLQRQPQQPLEGKYASWLQGCLEQQGVGCVHVHDQRDLGQKIEGGEIWWGWCWGVSPSWNSHRRHSAFSEGQNPAITGYS